MLHPWPARPASSFAPLTGLEVLRTRSDEGVKIIEVRPSVNLKALTIEKVVAKLQASVLTLIDVLLEEMRFAGVPARALMPLLSLKSETEQRDPSWFNLSKNYTHATDAVLQRQEAVFEALSRPEVWVVPLESTGVEAERRRRRSLPGQLRQGADVPRPSPWP